MQLAQHQRREQIGFRKGYSTTQAVNHLIDKSIEYQFSYWIAFAGYYEVYMYVYRKKKHWNHLRFADDIVLFSHNSNELQDLLTELETKKVNISKTK